MADEKTAPPAPPPAPAEQTITLLEAAEVAGDTWLKGKVLRVEATEAQRLVSAGKARVSTALDKKIAGVD